MTQEFLITAYITSILVVVSEQNKIVSNSALWECSRVQLMWPRYYAVPGYQTTTDQQPSLVTLYKPLCSLALFLLPCWGECSKLWQSLSPCPVAVQSWCRDQLPPDAIRSRPPIPWNQTSSLRWIYLLTAPASACQLTDSSTVEVPAMKAITKRSCYDRVVEWHTECEAGEWNPSHT